MQTPHNSTADTQPRNDPAPPEGPAWWQRALSLETADQLDAAEGVIREACPHIGFAYSTAEMYRQRMVRLKRAGNDDGALQAFLKASQFIFFYASMATSGGEGAALAAERDEFRAGLVREYGSDPEAARA